MALTLHLSPEIEKSLEERAQEQGVDVSAYVEELIAGKLARAPGRRPRRTFDEVLAPVDEYARAHGHTDEEIGQFVDAEMKAYRAEKRARRAQG